MAPATAPGLDPRPPAAALPALDRRPTRLRDGAHGIPSPGKPSPALPTRQAAPISPRDRRREIQVPFPLFELHHYLSRLHALALIHADGRNLARPGSRDVGLHLHR